MEDFMKIAFLFLVPILFGAGFMFVPYMTGFSPLRNFCSHFFVSILS